MGLRVSGEDQRRTGGCGELEPGLNSWPLFLCMAQSARVPQFSQISAIVFRQFVTYPTNSGRLLIYRSVYLESRVPQSLKLKGQILRSYGHVA